MDDPWDVKSVRRPGLYTSCMKINGVPLLPPVLSKECRKEMQYYKLLAKEVEKRISILEPYMLAHSEDSNDDTTDASEILDCEPLCALSQQNSPQKVDTKTLQNEKDLDCTLTSSPLHTEVYQTSHKSQICQPDNASSLTLDFTINETSSFKLTAQRCITPPVDVPERDYNCNKTPELLMDTEKISPQEKVIQSVNYSGCVSKDDSFTHTITSSVEGPLSAASKSFTGSLNNIHIESNSVHTPSKLIRQRSYTLLNPSPQLLAHLEVQSLNTGVEISRISMSDSLNNLTPSKKRRSWDLESAKMKWSNMAKELKQKNIIKPLAPQRNMTNRQQPKRMNSPQRAKSVVPERSRQNSLPSRSPPLKTEPAYRSRRPSPIRIASNRTIVKEPINTPPKIANQRKPDPTSPKNVNRNHIPNKTQRIERKLEKSPTRKPVVSECEDPAAKVRELYDKIQKQQLVQMANLVEKQKREQILLQQVFEEQNNLLFKQLKTICPLSPVEAKQAWSEKIRETDRGPVSLSQLINNSPKSPSPTTSENVVSVLNDSSNMVINHCNNVLMRSRDISKSSKNGNKSPPHLEGSKTRTNSPNLKTSRRLMYETSSSNQEYEPMLTDRTNDTMADLNVTFTSDSEDTHPFNFLTNQAKNDLSVIHSIPAAASESLRSTDSAIKSLERTIQNSIKNTCGVVKTQPTLKQRAAASTLVAYAKGYLVRRLMRTARVQATVQTIKDALVCALQLHQDREGIRGADVDLHRRLIQQITAACYTLHDTFISSTASERCALIAADRDRGRRASFAARPSPKLRNSDIMSQSHSGVFPPRQKPKRAASALMTQSYYESYSSPKSSSGRYMPSPRRRPWR